MVNCQNLKCPSFIALPCFDAKAIPLHKMKLTGALTCEQITEHWCNGQDASLSPQSMVIDLFKLLLGHSQSVSERERVS